MEHTGGTVPRLGTLFDLQAQELQAGDVGFFPLLAGVAIVVDVAVQIGDHELDRALWEKINEVGVEVIDAGLALLDADLQVAHVDVDRLGVNDLDFDGLFCGLCQTHGLLVQRFVNVRCHVYTLVIGRFSAAEGWLVFFIALETDEAAAPESEQCLAC